MRIICPFEIKSSHKYSDISYRHGNKLALTDLKVVQDINIHGNIVQELQIVRKEEKYEFQIICTSCNDIVQVKSLLSDIAELISFYMNVNNTNPHHGTYYIEMDFFDLKAEGLEPPVKMGMTTEDRLNVSSVNFNDINHEEILEHFYEGARTELPKSKYFHWFTILEYLENCEKYTQLFVKDRLFDDEDVNKVRQLAKTMGDQRKKDIVLGILKPKYTIKNRAQKLAEFLNDFFGIAEINVLHEYFFSVNVELIEEIIKTRHKLYHKGVQLDEKILWFKLYPIILDVMKKLIIEKYDIS